MTLQSMFELASNGQGNSYGGTSEVWYDEQGDNEITLSVVHNRRGAISTIVVELSACGAYDNVSLSVDITDNCDVDKALDRISCFLRYLD